MEMEQIRDYIIEQCKYIMHDLKIEDHHYIRSLRAEYIKNLCNAIEAELLRLGHCITLTGYQNKKPNELYCYIANLIKEAKEDGKRN